MRAVDSAVAPLELPPDLDHFLAVDAEEDEHRWVIPDMLEAGDRLILTGGEGSGKSTLLRQWGLQAAAGVHPFTGKSSFPPVRVLLLDAENSARQLRRQLRPLHEVTPIGFRADRYRIDVRAGDIDLASPTVAAELADVILELRAQLLVIGPLYKIASGDPVKEEDARLLSRGLDLIRERTGVAMMIEAHSPHADGKTPRALRPYGASLWLRWPEFGIGLGQDGSLKHWRGQREERPWPAKLTREGGVWPWSPVLDEGTAQSEWRPTNAMAAARRFLDQWPAEWFSSSKVIEGLADFGSGYRKQTVLDALRILAEEGSIRSRPGPRKAIEYSLNGDQEELW